jgi:hypothetical protein
MATVACPGCGLPRAEGEVGATPCPVCHAAPSAVEAPRAAKQVEADPTDALPADASELYAPAPKPARKGTRAGGSRLLAVALAFLLGALCGVGGVLGVQAINRPAPQPRGPEVAELPKLDAPAAPQKPAVPAVAPMPREVVARPVPKLDPVAVGEFQLPDPLPPPGVVVTHTVNKPDDVYPIPTMKKGEHIVLKGKVKTLRVHGLDAGAVLDASGLEASVVTVTGKIDNRSTLKLKAPNGAVQLTAKVTGQSVVEINAPGGEVKFLLPTTEKREGSKIDGGSAVAVTARWIEFKGDITGNNTKVAVTLSRNAILKVASVGGRATVEYRAQPGGLSPDVIVGDVARTALFRKVQ